MTRARDGVRRKVTSWLLWIVGLVVFFIAARAIEEWLEVSARSSDKLLGLVLVGCLFLVLYGLVGLESLHEFFRRRPIWHKK